MNGHAFDVADYTEIMVQYHQLVEREGCCTVRRLASVAAVSVGTAKKAISFVNDGKIVMKPNGRPKTGLGSSYGFDEEDHMCIYELYLENPYRPLEDYCMKLFEMRGKLVSNSLISR